MTRPHGLSPEQVRQVVAETRREQGLPPTVTDPVVLRRLVDLCAVVRRDEEAAA